MRSLKIFGLGLVIGLLIHICANADIIIDGGDRGAGGDGISRGISENESKADLAPSPNQPPLLVLEPANKIVTYGSKTGLNALAQGSGTLNYQWYKDGIVINNTGGYDGTSTTNLTINPIGPIHEGNYWMVVKNAYGSITSQVAQLSLVKEVPVVEQGAWPAYPRGPAFGVVVVGQYAYVAAAYAGLHVIDISNPASPKQVGGYDTKGDANNLAVVGKYAYVADGDFGLQVIDISSPLNPKLIGGYDTGGYAMEVAVAGGYAYVADGNNGLQVIDISNPVSPQRVGGYESSGYAYSISVAGNYAYLAARENGLQVVNISNPANPLRVGSYDTAGYAFGVTLSGQYAYVADGIDGLQVINISNPASPQRMGGFDTSGYAVGVAVLGNYAYIADGEGGIQVIDITNPGSPVRKCGYDTSGYAYSVAVMGNYAYVADDIAGLQIVDVSNLTSPQRIGGYETSGYTMAVGIEGNYAYVADGDVGLQVVNISNPADPQRVGGYNTSGYAEGVAVQGNYAYVAGGGSGLQVIYIGIPTNPQQIGGYDTSGYAEGVTVMGNYAYVADGDAGLHVISISNPGGPIRVGGYDTSGYAKGVAVVGNYAYVADGEAGLQVINISNPASPQWVGGYDTSGYAEGVVVVGSYAYVADGEAGLQVINISNPASPQWVGEDSTILYAEGVAVLDSYAYVADGYVGLQVINISNPANPQWVGEYISRGYAYGIAVRGNYAYVANGYYGLAAVQISGIAPVMVQQPADLTGNVGDRILYSAWASGTPPLFYQWYFNEMPILGETNPVLRLDLITKNHSGCYWVVVSNEWGTVVSSNGLLSLGGIDGWRMTYFSRADLMDIKKEATEWGDEADPDGDGLKNLFEYALGSNPIKSEFYQGLSTELVTTNGVCYVKMTFKQRKNDNRILYIPEVSTNGQSWISKISHIRWIETTSQDDEFNRVTYQSVSTISAENPIYIRLRVVKGDNGIPITIVHQPENVTVTAGTTATFQVEATASTGMYYQWMKNGVGIEGETNATLIITNAQNIDAGCYSAVIRTENDLIISQSAILTVTIKVPENLVWIPPGTFLMGNPANDLITDAYATPQTKVNLTRGFWMSRFPVTQKQFETLMGTNPSNHKGDPNLPVEMVTWYEAVNYCSKLNAEEKIAGRLPKGYVYRLPTDAEWEYACRAGTSTSYFYGDDPGYTNLATYAWYSANSNNETHPVGLLAPNPWGLYDMNGNVGQWCLDWFAYNLPGGIVYDPVGPIFGVARVVRGGAYTNSGQYSRSTQRAAWLPDRRKETIGFRPVLGAEL